jgi:hypothetical protein
VVSRSVSAYLVFSPLLLAANPDPREIIRKLSVVDAENDRRAQEYTMVEKRTDRVFDSSGRVKTASSKTFDILNIDGIRYHRQTEKDGKPLPSDEARKAQETIDRKIAERKNETEAQRHQHITEQEKRRTEARSFLKEIPDAFNFQILREETLDSRRVWVIRAEPNAGYRPHRPEARILQKFHCTLWIDQTDYQWAKADCESLDTVAFGLFLARLNKGAHIIFEQTRLNNEVWLLKRIEVKYDVRLALFKHQSGEFEQVHSNFRKFQADSKIVPSDEQ